MTLAFNHFLANLMKVYVAVTAHIAFHMFTLRVRPSKHSIGIKQYRHYDPSIFVQSKQNLRGLEDAKTGNGWHSNEF